MIVVYPTREHHVVQRIRRVDLQIQVEPVVSRNVRANEAFIENWSGPVIESRPALPHWPGAGAVNAAGFRK